MPKPSPSRRRPAPEEAMSPGLVDDVIREILLRLPPDDPGCLLRASLACKRWRRILADSTFSSCHRALYPAPSVVGYLQVVSDRVPYRSRFVPGNPASGRPAGRDLPGWLALDCRHGRALFVTPAAGLDITEEDNGAAITLDFIVWDPLTNKHRRLPAPSNPPTCHRTGNISFNAAVVCAAAAGGCDHRGCHGGPFRVAFVFTTWARETDFVTSATMYSSETDTWSGLTSVQLQPPVLCVSSRPCTSALVGDTLYFNGQMGRIFGYQLGSRRLTEADPPRRMRELYMASVDGKLGFFNVEEEQGLSLCLRLQETAPNGVAQWAWGWATDLGALLPSNVLLPPQLASASHHPICIRRPFVVGFAEGTDVILVVVPTNGFDGGIYMVELNSGRNKKIFEGISQVYPYTSFCIPVIDSGSTSKGPEKGVPSV